MKISGNDPGVRDAYVRRIYQHQKKDAASKPGVKSVEKADTVKISDEARELQETQKVMENIPDVRVEKVAKIKNQIEKGTYDIKSGNIAAKMIKDTLLNERL
jgi:negative regulator of flagellin synthesis FlgM